MRKQIKKSLILALSTAFVVSLGVAGVAQNVISASATTLGVENNFEMRDGAAIRILDNEPSGIRWKADVTQAYYDYAKKLGTNVVFGMEVLDKSGTVLTSIDRWTVDSETTPTFENDVWTYTASITYDELEKNDSRLTAAYEMELQAKAYVKYTDSNSTEQTVYAEDADVLRSIKGVAINCLVEENTTGNDDVTTGNQETFEAYAGGKYTVTGETVTKNAYNLTNATGTVKTQDELKAGTYEVYVGAKRFEDVTLTEDGKATATVAGLGSTIAVKGEENNVRFINANGEVYQVPFVSATHVISTPAEMKSFFNTYSSGSGIDTTGWYVALTGNIELSNKDGTASYERYAKTKNLTWLGHFNGLGHTVSNIELTGNGGLFGNLGANSIIENVGFTNLTVTGYEYVIAHESLGVSEMPAYVRNVYLQGTATAGVATMVCGATGTNISNVVANFENALEGEVDGVYLHQKTASLSNNYCIGDFDYAKKSSGTSPEATLCNITTFNTTYLNDFTSENGFNEYWSIKDSSLYFGDTKVE